MITLLPDLLSTTGQTPNAPLITGQIQAAEPVDFLAIMQVAIETEVEQTISPDSLPKDSSTHSTENVEQATTALEIAPAHTSPKPLVSEAEGALTRHPTEPPDFVPPHIVRPHIMPRPFTDESEIENSAMLTHDIDTPAIHTQAFVAAQSNPPVADQGPRQSFVPLPSKTPINPLPMPRQTLPFAPPLATSETPSPIAGNDDPKQAQVFRSEFRDLPPTSQSLAISQGPDSTVTKPLTTTPVPHPSLGPQAAAPAIKPPDHADFAPATPLKAAVSHLPISPSNTPPLDAPTAQNHAIGLLDSAKPHSGPASDAATPPPKTNVQSQRVDLPSGTEKTAYAVSHGPTHPTPNSPLLTPNAKATVIKAPIDKPQFDPPNASTSFVTFDPETSPIQNSAFPSEQRLASSVATQAMTQPQIVTRQIAQQFAQSPNHQTELILAPKELGRLHITLNTSDHGISLHIQADRAETLDLLRRNIGLLGQDFSALGYSNLNFSFSQQGRQNAVQNAEIHAAAPEDVDTQVSGSAPPTITPIASAAPVTRLDIRL